MTPTQHQFGGDWTAEKLERVRKYLAAYTTIMAKKKYRFAYIDAFAGTGYRTLKEDETQEGLLLPEFAEQEAEEFLEGSARIALQVKPRFTKYIFIEKVQHRFDELTKLKAEFPELENDIELVNQEANSYLADLCQNISGTRTALFSFLTPTVCRFHGIQLSPLRKRRR